MLCNLTNCNNNFKETEDFLTSMPGNQRVGRLRDGADAQYSYAILKQTLYNFTTNTLKVI